jgi:pyruvate/2-oxoglutarate dehydrogenase complex dihydrolipoamide acyltransferase (E2) component
MQEGAMPYGARLTLAALIVVVGFGGASAEPAPGTTWTDPPAHKPAAQKAPAAEPKAAAPAPVAATPAAAAPVARPAPRKAVAARRTPERRVARGPSPHAKRVAAAPRRARVAAAPVRTFRDPQRAVAVAPPPPPAAEGYARYRAYGYGPGYGYAPVYTDDRLDRLSSAQAAGYLVVRRRTVQFPDGRTLRVYRPEDEGDPF